MKYALIALKTSACLKIASLTKLISLNMLKLKT